MSVLEHIKAARERIAKPENWTRKAYARDRAGMNIWPRWPGAVCWCSIGALTSVGAATDENAMAAMAQQELEKDLVGGNLMAFNDASTHAEVIAAFDKTIARLEST